MITRRALVSGTGAWILAGGAAADGPPALTLERGPHLFLDDFLIERQEGFRRLVRPPQRHGPPILSNARFGTTQPYLGVLRDPDTQRIRLWYNHGPQIWHADSGDGVEWSDPRVAWALRRCYGVTVIDDRGRDPDPDRRFKLANWQASREDREGDDSGMWVGFSPDGFRWTAGTKNPALPTWPDGYGKPLHHSVGDIVDAFYDPIRKRYGAAVKVHAIPGDGFAKGPRAGDQFMRRWIGMSVSDDFVHWKQPWQIAVAEREDPGLTEFYGMGGVHARGSLLIGFARVLRDDLSCDAGGPANGIGHSCLMTSRDGVRWERIREPFLDRAPEPGWDHAMSWMSGALPMGDELFLYYGGYARGHKVEAQTERQIGLARMPRDRYASQTAGGEGRLVTSLVRLNASTMTLNSAIRGSLRARLLGQDDKPLAGFDFEDGQPLRGDRLEHPLAWKRSLSSLRNRSVRLEIQARDADLYAIDLA